MADADADKVLVGRIFALPSSYLSSLHLKSSL